MFQEQKPKTRTNEPQRWRVQQTNGGKNNGKAIHSNTVQQAKLSVLISYHHTSSKTLVWATTGTTESDNRFRVSCVTYYDNKSLP